MSILSSIIRPKYPVRYSEMYSDDNYQYITITFTDNKYNLGSDKLLTGQDFIELGLPNFAKWEHYMIFPPEPNILLLRRPLSNRY